MVDDDSDEMLGARLDSALAALTLVEVDVETLVRGSRRRARRVQGQRIGAAVVAAVLIVGVPLGYEVAHPGAGTAQPAALLPSDPAGTGPAKTISDSFAFTGAELPTGLALARSSPDADGRLVDGQVCAGRERPSPVAGRQWVWSTDPGQTDDLSVSLTVTGWADGQAATAFTTAIEETGYCTWKGPQTPHALPISAEQSWAATSDRNGEHYARAVVQVGAGIVGVQVRHPKSAAAAATIADRLATIQVARLRRSVLAGGG